MQSVSPVQKSGAHISYYGITCSAVYALMFSSSAHGGSSDGIGLRFGGKNFTMLNVLAPEEQQFLLEQLRHLSSSGITGQEARQAAEDEGEQSSSDLARNSAEDLNNTGLLQSVRVWTDNAHTYKVSMSSSLLMEIDKGCLQPSVFDGSVFG